MVPTISTEGIEADFAWTKVGVINRISNSKTPSIPDILFFIISSLPIWLSFSIIVCKMKIKGNKCREKMLYLQYRR
jgi:hypothetical protein